MTEQQLQQQQNPDAYKGDLGKFLAQMLGLAEQSRLADQQLEDLVKEIAKRLNLELPGKEQAQPPASEQQ